MKRKHTLRRLIAVLGASFMMCGALTGLPVSPSAPENAPLTAEAAYSVIRTQAEAVQWARDRVAEGWEKDIDKGGTCECVDLTNAYFKYLYGIPDSTWYWYTGHAYQYETNSPPPGFTKVTSNPQPGDVFVQNKAQSGGSYGHVGIVIGVSGNELVTAETNYWRAHYGNRKCRSRPLDGNHLYISNVACFLRPSFQNPDPVPQPSGSATVKDGVYMLKNVGSGYAMNYSYGSTAAGKPILMSKYGDEDANEQHFKFVHTGSGKYRIDIQHANGGVINCECNLPVTAGVDITARTSSNNDTQRFYATPVGNGEYILQSASDYSLVIGAASSDFHAKLTTQIYSSSNALQRWTFSPDPTITVPAAVTLSSISIGATPSKTTYYQGDTLDTTGLKVTAAYSDGTSKSLTSGFKTTADLSKPGTATVTVSYTDGGITKTATFKVTVKPNLSSLTLTSKPTKTTYAFGQKFDKTGMKVTVTYTDGTTKDVTDTAQVTGYSASKSGKQTLTVSYSENGKTVTGSFTVTVSNSIKRISVATLPDRLSFHVGEIINTNGMKVVAIYEDGSEKDVTDEVSIAYDFSKPGTSQVALSYTEDGAAYTVSYTVTVTNSLTGIELVSLPESPAVHIGETLDTTGLTVIATYQDGSEKDVTKDVTLAYDFSKSGTSVVSVTYAEGDKRFKSTFNMTVLPALSMITVTPPETDSFRVGSELDPADLRITAEYEDGTTRDVTGRVRLSYDFSAPGKKTVTVIYEENGVKTTASFVVNVTEAPETVPGDVNADGKVDVKDAVLLARYLGNDNVTFTDVAAANADVDGQTGVSSDDLSTLLLAIANLITL